MIIKNVAIINPAGPLPPHFAISKVKAREVLAGS